jgi:molybdate transport system substrate-binding protein
MRAAIAGRLAAAFVLAAASTVAFAKDVVVLCAGAVKPALEELAPAFAQRTGHKLHITYATAGDLRRLLAQGTRADVVILPLENFVAIEKDGVTQPITRRSLGAVGIGVAVREGARVPDISTEEGLKRALLEARSLTYVDPTRGTSGRHIDEVVLPQLGIRDAVRAKATLGEGGMVAEKVAHGDVELAIQQMSELLPVRGVHVVGPLPPSLQKTTVYAAALASAAAAPDEGHALLAFLVSDAARSVFGKKGFGAAP